ncbi:hypothetical protein A2154_02495 [Candidatus Gottesmanbacteria bacterium RBG_16_43_7]|uniref:Uncharacterized protein n=1 Tax=Candidatus Gottesmanbacteria bacterium RBG_16_43_7 TaxID=1798373 RepID=A0A1F5ZC38_9BACT|nr:MAG: hypothetical protein A2154_02495 [Candidatus Gottesmanbacteria bacterium RBG_16_43_7]
MPKVISQIIGSFEDIGKDVVKQTAPGPVDISKTAIESIGVAKSQPAPLKSPDTAPLKAHTPDDFDRFSAVTVDTRKIMARKALQALLERPQSKQPDIFEQKNMAEEQKKAEAAKLKKLQNRSRLPHISAPRKVPHFGVAVKQQGSETGKNIRQD